MREQPYDGQTLFGPSGTARAKILKRTERALPEDLNWLPQELRGVVEALFAAG
jgi:hypothetical protein